MTQDYDKPATEYFSKRQDYDKPAPEFFRKQGNQWTPVDSPAPTSPPITPPPELVQQWLELSPALAIAAAFQAGADQELEACCGLIEQKGFLPSSLLRMYRRPNPPSLKEQALALVEQHEDGWRPSPKDWDTIRRALEALPND
jgi:hypothetical protein